MSQLNGLMDSDTLSREMRKLKSLIIIHSEIEDWIEVSKLSKQLQFYKKERQIINSVEQFFCFERRVNCS